MVLKMQRDRAPPFPLLGSQFGEAAALQPAHPTQDGAHACGEFATYLIRQTAITDDLPVYRLYMSGRIKTQLLTLRQTLYGYATELRSRYGTFFPTHGTPIQVRHLNRIRLTQHIAVEPMPHKQFVRQRTDRQPPFFTEQYQRIYIRRMIWQHQMCRLITQQFLPRDADVIMPMEKELYQLTDGISIHAAKLLLFSQMRKLFTIKICRTDKMAVFFHLARGL